MDSNEHEINSLDIFNTFQESIFILDQNQKIEFANRYAISSLPLDEKELLNLKFTDLFETELTDLLADLGDEIIEDQIFWFKDNPQKRFIGRINPVKPKSGQLNRYVVSFINYFDEQSYRQKLRISEAKEKAILGTIPDLIFILSCKGVFLDYHVNYPDLLFVPPEQFLHKSCFQVLPPELAEQTIQAIKQAISTGEIQKYEYNLEFNQETRYFEGRMVKLDPYRVLTIIRDISERKKIQNALAESERKYRDLFNRASVGIAIIQEGIIQLVNPMICSIMGYQESELQGKYFVDFLPPSEKHRAETFYIMTEDNFQDLVEEKDLELARDYFTRLKEKYEADLSYETMILNKQQELIYAEVNAGNMIYNHKEASLILIRDITKQKKAEQALKKSENLYRMLVENVFDGIYLMRNRGYEYVNPEFCRITGYSFEELTSPDFDFKNLLPPSSLVEVEDRYRARVNQKPIPDKYETQLINKDGDIVDVEIGTVVIEDPQDLYVLGIIRDVSQKKKNEQKQQQFMNKLKDTQKLESLGVLAGGIAHDFNNLLVGILGNADLILKSKIEPDKILEKVSEIDIAAKRAAELCRQMLAYSGKGVFVIQNINLNELIEEISHLLETSISKKAELNYNFEQSLPSIEGDITQIRQVIMNLITNASESLEDKPGTITITTGSIDCDMDYIQSTLMSDLSPGKYVSVEVSDSGCGMDKNILDKIFEPFFSTKFTGRGLGLSAVSGIVRAHEGAIKVYSEPGQGTTFKILFPCSKSPNHYQNKKFEEIEQWKGSGTVMLVDDDDTVRPVVQGMLESIGYNVILAEDGYQAIEILADQSEKVHCIILDLTMPKMDGRETLVEIKKINPNLPIILSSGYNESDVKYRFTQEEKFSAFLQKPYRLSDLIEKISQVLNDS